MTYDIYRYIFIGGAILAGIMFGLSVLLFFLLKIPHVFGDLTGRNARKAIEDIRNHNVSSGDKVHKTSKVNRERGKITDRISASGNVIKAPIGDSGGVTMPTEKISTQGLPPEANETTVLNTANETTVLNDDVGATTVLDAQPYAAPVFQIEYEITYIHSEEVI